MIFRALCVAAIFALTFYAHASRPVYDYRCVANASDNIVLAKVSSISRYPVVRGGAFDFYLVRLDISSSIKGAVERKGVGVDSFEILWAKEDFHSPRFKVGGDYLLFMKNSANGYFLINGAQGGIDVINNKAEVYGTKLGENGLRKFVEISARSSADCRGLPQMGSMP